MYNGQYFEPKSSNCALRAGDYRLSSSKVYLLKTNVSSSTSGAAILKGQQENFLYTSDLSNRLPPV